MTPALTASPARLTTTKGTKAAIVPESDLKVHDLFK